MTPKLLSITEVGEATGLQSSALRYYERAGLITPEARIGGRRHYSPDVLHRLSVVALLQEAGFTISEIGEVIRRKQGTHWRSLAENKLKEIDDHIQQVTEVRELLTAALECSCSQLERCDLVSGRRSRHGKVVQTLPLRIGRPD